MMVRHKLVDSTWATLLVVVILELLFAATSISPIEDLRGDDNPTTSISPIEDLRGDDNPIRSRAQRIRRQHQQCNYIRLENNVNFWKQHNKDLTFNASEAITNGNVVVYTNRSLASIVRTWVLDYVTPVWEYIEKETTYVGVYKGEMSCLAVVIHEGKYPGDQHTYERNISNIARQLNILDIGSEKPNLWTDETKRIEAKDMITNQLAYFVEFSSNEKLGSPSSHIWKSSSSQDSAYVEIFTYDVYMNVKELRKSAEPYKNKTLLKWHKTTFPKNETFWFRDWFFPIYEKYKGRTVLNSYFTILANNVPAVYYEADNPNKMTMGEFVRFWSGAAGEDLAPLAWNAFGWNRTLEKELKAAQDKYKLFYELTNETYNFNDNEDNIRTPKNNDDNPETNSGISEESAIIWGSTGVAFILVLIAACIIGIAFYNKKVDRLQKQIRSLTNKEVKDFFEGDPNVSKKEMMSLVQASPFVMQYEVSKDRLILGNNKILGSGAYGCVIRGFIRQLDSSELLPVAVKTVKPDVEVSQFKAILSEAKIMAYLGQHQNIVLLCGTYTANIREREIYIALELCTLGDLQKYLKNNKAGFQIQSLSQGQEGVSQQITDAANETASFSILNLFKWSHDISNAMVYLTEKRVIHGDLAARNVLLTANRVAKVSDFGLSRQLLNYANYMKTTECPLPWRWMAIESLRDMEFSIASDVWAFGVTLWEIFSLGGTPYPGWTWNLGFVDRLAAGDRLQTPAYANATVFKLMQDCWKLLPTERPSFQTIYNSFGDLVKTQVENVGQNYIDLFSS